jgi:hypothetical protein
MSMERLSGDPAQAVVARLMAIGVVVGLEVIHVGDEQRNRPLVARGAAPFQ